MGFVKLYLNLYPHWLQFRTPNPAPQFFGLSKFRTCLAGSLILSLVGERIHFAWLMDMKIKPKIHLHLHPSSRVPLLQRHFEKKCFKKGNQTSYVFFYLYINFYLSKYKSYIIKKYDFTYKQKRKEP